MSPNPRRYPHAPYWQVLRACESRMLSSALERGKNVMGAAKLLGIAPKYFMVRAAAYNIPCGNIGGKPVRLPAPKATPPVPIGAEEGFVPSERLRENAKIRAEKMRLMHEEKRKDAEVVEEEAGRSERAANGPTPGPAPDPEPTEVVGDREEGLEDPTLEEEDFPDDEEEFEDDAEEDDAAEAAD